MVSIRTQMAKQMGCQEAYSIIDRNNLNNLTPYFANQFLLISSGIDPTDNGPIYTMKINLNQRGYPPMQHPTQLPITSRTLKPQDNALQLSPSHHNVNIVAQLLTAFHMFWAHLSLC
jgi:hypothetical protein